MKRVILPLFGMLALSACATTQDRLARFQGMSCGELAVAIDYENKAKEQARIRALGHGIAGVAGKKSERTSEEIAANIETANADNREDLVNELRHMAAARGCDRRY